MEIRGLALDVHGTLAGESAVPAPDCSPIAVQALLEAHGASVSYQAWDAAYRMAFFVDYPRRDAADWSAFRKTLEKQKAQVSDSVWTADRPFMLRQIRAELASATLGALERYKIAVEDDSQLSASLELFPRASQLMAGALEPTGKTGKPGKPSPRDFAGKPGQHR